MTPPAPLNYWIATATKPAFALPTLKELVDTLDEETNPKVLVNTCDALELESLKAIQKYNLIGIGQLIPSAFLDGRDPSDTSFAGDLFKKSRDYIEWLNSKPESSVVYSRRRRRRRRRRCAKLHEITRPTRYDSVVVFSTRGSFAPMFGVFRDALWVEFYFGELGFWGSGGGVSSLVRSNDECEDGDRGVGDRVRVKANEEGIVESEEVKRCIEEVMGGEERGEEMRRNAKKWKELTREAMKEGGSSDLNLKAFVENIGGGNCSSRV
ncbi:hypothetical protein HYC85_013092 [Camellia sinensis]|uniref:Uncharacterized protein n=1 Tax=Camellia sinensis TaxID=4442 RepID=A0A7J7HEC5_CAMSI|nr:hypothetical protein HYC85_013092 [Camellia sinensis]